ncbi:hypothetical protein DFH27DRAFT_609926 [Peziza echinospora]|nr:hypothetical protein DFH27DRAFT_609926 [Peziza echinospora]
MYLASTTFAVPQENYGRLVTFLYGYNYNIGMHIIPTQGSRQITITVVNRDWSGRKGEG